MLVKMLTNAASPNRVLEAGKTYNLPADIAEPLLAKDSARAGQSCAVRVSGGKVTKLPFHPDPEDFPEQVDVDDDEDATE
jgi:hypothetical protein